MKRVARFLITIFVLPTILLYYACRLILPKQRAFADFSQLMALCPGILGEYARHAFYRAVLPRCGTDACVGFGVILSHPTAKIGNRVYIGPYSVLGDVTLEDDVLLASGVSIANGTRQHGIDRVDIPIREQPGEFPPLVIGEDSWLGERAIVLANVGKHCVVGAGSLVLDDVPDYAIVVGVPAKVVKMRGLGDSGISSLAD